MHSCTRHLLLSCTVLKEKKVMAEGCIWYVECVKNVSDFAMSEILSSFVFDRPMYLGNSQNIGLSFTAIPHNPHSTIVEQILDLTKPNCGSKQVQTGFGPVLNWFKLLIHSSKKLIHSFKQWSTVDCGCCGVVVSEELLVKSMLWMAEWTGWAINVSGQLLTGMIGLHNHPVWTIIIHHIESPILHHRPSPVVSNISSLSLATPPLPPSLVAYTSFTSWDSMWK